MLTHRAVMAFATSAAAALLLSGCQRAAAVEEIPVGSQVTIETTDGRLVKGRLAQVTVDRVVVRSDAAGERREISRDTVSQVRRGAPGLGSLFSRAPEPVETTIPAGRTVSISLVTTVTSAANRPEDPVLARTRAAVMVGETIALPAGSELRGTITAAQPSGKVEGRARLGFRFTEVKAYGEWYDLSAAPFGYRARGTKGRDARNIGIGAAAGAIIGGIAGGRKGAVIGSAIGGGAGTAVVLTTPGKEIELASGTPLRLRLVEPLLIRVPRNLT